MGPFYRASEGISCTKANLLMSHYVFDSNMYFTDDQDNTTPFTVVFIYASDTLRLPTHIDNP